MARRWPLTLTILILLAGTPTAAASTARFEGKAVDGDRATHRPKGLDYELRFRDHHRAGTLYRLCAGTATRRGRCKGGRTGRPGRNDVISALEMRRLPADRHIVWRWLIDGVAVASWKVMVGPPPPKAPPSFCSRAGRPRCS